MAEFQSFLAARHGRLVIAGPPSVTASLLPALLKRFTSEHPNIDLQILDALSDNVLRAVELGEADLGFTAGTVAARGRLSFHRLLDDEFVAVEHPTARSPNSAPWSELLEMPFAAMAPGTSVRELLDAASQRVGRAFLSPVSRCRTWRPPAHSWRKVSASPRYGR